MPEDSSAHAHRAPDPRPARTRSAILTAVETLGKKGAELNVSSIVHEAGLSRSSFYSQFKDVGDIAVQLVTELYVEIESLDAEPRSKGQTDAATVQTAEMLLNEFWQRRHLYTAVLGGGANVSAQWAVCEVMGEGVLKSIERSTPPDIDTAVASRFIAAGILASTIDWIASEDALPLPEFHKRVLQMLPAWLSKKTSETE